MGKVKKGFKVMALLSRTRSDFDGTPPDILENTPLIDTMDDTELAEHFLDRLRIQARIGLNGEDFPGTTPENLAGLRKRTEEYLLLDIQYAVEKGRPVPPEVSEYFQRGTKERR